MFSFLLLSIACDACGPRLPSTPDVTRVDTSEPPPDSGQDSAPIDTAPEPLCGEEIEPNNAVDDAQALVMEEWACGTFGTYLDTDWYEFTNAQEGWVKVLVESASRGSSSNAQFQVVGDETSALVLDSYLSTDPKIVFPASAGASWQVALADTTFSYGEDFTWWLMATQSKAPVEWTSSETEPNDSANESNTFTISETVYGVIDSPEDFDWYHITTGEEEAILTFTVEAYAHGSAADLKLVLYESDGTTVVLSDYQGEIDYDPDPYFRKRVTGATDWYLLVRTQDDRGSPFHWYTLTITSAPSGA